MNSKALNIVVSLVFFIVGSVAVSNSIRLNRYIGETIPRDTQQEACQLATLQSLRVWAIGRYQIEEAKIKRDQAVYPVLAALMAGERPNPQISEALNIEYHNTDQVRLDVEQMLAATPIPKCELLGKGLK